MGFFQSIAGIVREADIVLLIVDARMPELSKNEELEWIVQTRKKALWIVFNKIDLVNRDILAGLRKDNPDAFFVSGNKNIGLAKIRQAILIYAKRNGYMKIKVGVVGYPNVGKSSIINALAHRARAITSSVAGTTKGPQFIRISERIKIIDSPGVIPMRDRETKLGIIAAKNPEKLKNKERVAYEIIKIIMAKSPKSLEDFYGIKIEEGMDEEAILIAIGKRKGSLKRGGVVDETRTALALIMDWQKGKLRL